MGVVSSVVALGTYTVNYTVHKLSYTHVYNMCIGTVILMLYLDYTEFGVKHVYPCV